MKKSLMKWALGLLLIGFLLLPRLRESTGQTQPAVWLTSLEEALKTARETGKPILIDFQADWCGPCHMMREQVFEAPIFKPEASRWVLLAIDVDKQPEIAAKYRASSLPMLLVLNSQGQPALFTSGYRNPEFTLEFLKAAHAKASS